MTKFKNNPVHTVPWTIQQVRRNVHTVRTRINGSGELWVLLMADEHWDNPHCRLDLLKAHHDEAIKRKALILKFGDTFCAMQGKFDKRSSKDDVREEHQNGDYLDSLVSTAAEWYRPYAGNIGIIGQGNHETAVRARHETDLVERLAERLRQGGGITTAGGYSGWVRFMIRATETQCRSFRLFYHHGFGGGGPVTKGLIDFNRMAEWADADAIVSGHIHTKTYTTVKRLRLNDSSVPSSDTMHYIRCSTYKDEYADGAAGYHIEKGRGPRPLGGWWMRLSVAGKAQRLNVEFSDATE